MDSSGPGREALLGGEPRVDQPAPRGLRRRVLEYYDRHRRDLPWRREQGPYGVWISEVMLQQTRAESVVPYYRRWMERFPDVEALAGAPEDDVLEAWAGLGYYARARNLWRAARRVRDGFGGRLPRGLEELRGLPGIGEYTAAAVASIAYGVPAAAVDGNVRRVLSRLLDLASAGPAQLRAHAARLLDPARPGDFNQALMDLGATVCTPTAPRCPVCPVASDCLALARGTVGERPPTAARARPREKSFAVAVLADPARRVLLVRRPAQGLLARLWAFPERQLLGRASDARMAWGIARSLGFAEAAPGPALLPVRHAFTHLRALYLPVLLLVSGKAAAGSAPDDDARWVDTDAPAGIALPAAQKRIAAAAVRALGTTTPCQTDA